jgi:prevent-host-death family protein
MDVIPVSRFKATCLAVVQRVQRTGRSILITRYGKPVAEVVPPRRQPQGSDWIGSMAGRGATVGDIVSPATDPGTWDALSR